MFVIMSRRTAFFDVDKLKWLLALTVSALGIWTSFVFIAESLLYRLLLIIFSGGVSISLILQTEQGQDFWAMLRSARIEIKKVVWPTHQETIQTLLLIMLFVLFMAVVLWLMDSVLGWAVKFFIS